MSGFFLLSFLSSASASTVFKIANDTPYLNISFPKKTDTTSLGPSDFVVFNGLIAVLDSDGNQISFFDQSGKYIKKIQLPKGYYQRLIRDRNNILYAFANDGLSSSIVKIDGQQTERKIIDGNLDSIISQAIIDDVGLFFKKNNFVNSSFLKQLDTQKIPLSTLSQLKLESYYVGYRINNDCFSCDVAKAQSAIVRGISYKINYKNDKGQKPSLIIGNREIKLNQKYQNAGARIEQIDSNGTAWVEQSIFLNEKIAETYILKILPSGEIDSIFHLPPIHPDDYVVHQIAISDQGQVWIMRGMPDALSFDIVNPLPKNEKFYSWKWGAGGQGTNF